MPDHYCRFCGDLPRQRHVQAHVADDTWWHVECFERQVNTLVTAPITILRAAESTWMLSLYGQSPVVIDFRTCGAICDGQIRRFGPGPLVWMLPVTAYAVRPSLLSEHNSLAGMFAWCNMYYRGMGTGTLLGSTQVELSPESRPSEIRHTRRVQVKPCG